MKERGLMAIIVAEGDRSSISFANIRGGSGCTGCKTYLETRCAESRHLGEHVPKDAGTDSGPSVTYFTPRQLVALTTFSDLVAEASGARRAGCRHADLPNDGRPLRDGGAGATAYAEAVVIYWLHVGSVVFAIFGTQSRLVGAQRWIRLSCVYATGPPNGMGLC